MPSSYLVDAKASIVYSRCWGVLTDDQLEAAAEALGSDPRFDPSFRHLADFLGVTQILVTSRGVRAIATATPFRRNARRAFVVASDEAFGLTRMFGFFTESSVEDFGIFRALEPAFEWLGLPKDSKWPAGEPDRSFGV
jgi:hypothetical protein